ncbi:MAG: hypothetical protein IKM26_09625 [Clostridia bacterium]|nr:hypothetical protein [Clostridia bacterium]
MTKKFFLVLMFIVLAGVVGYTGGLLTADISHEFSNHAEIALRKTGLNVQYAPEYSLYGFTGFRDSFSQTKFAIEYDHEKQQIFSDMKLANNWHISPVSAEDFLAFQEACAWTYSSVLDLPANIIFDAWYYLETCAPAAPSSPAVPSGALSAIGQIGHGFEFAVYDLETGLFIFIDQHG